MGPHRARSGNYNQRRRLEIQKSHVKRDDLKVHPAEERDCHDKGESGILPDCQRHHCLQSTFVLDPEEQPEKKD